MRIKPFGFIALTVFSLLHYRVSAANRTFEEYRLQNDSLTAVITPELGGRLMQFSLNGYENFIKIGEPYLTGQQPEVSPSADNIGYLGHIVWLSPQSLWWQRQTSNRQRLASKAPWPPDPFLIFAANQTKKYNQYELSLQGVHSPVSGIRLDKHFALREDHLELSAKAFNSGEKAVSWGLWFNTRVAGDTTIIIPVNKHSFVRTEYFSHNQNLPLSIKKNLAVFAAPNSHDPLQGKLFIAPQRPWLAAASNGQLLIMQFPQVSPTSVHPEQSPLEIYFNLIPDSATDSLIELELHSAYKKILPTKSISFSTRWYAFPYPEHWTQQQLTDFTQQIISSW